MLLTIGACLVTLVSAYGFGAGQYLLGVGGALLVSVTLLGLRRVGALLQRWGCRARSWC